MRLAALSQATTLSIEQAIQVAAETSPGVVVEAKLKKKLNKVAWKIKLVTEHGRVRIYVDGNSGAVISSKLDPTEAPALPLEPTRVVAQV